MTTIPSGFSIDSYPVDTSSSVFSELERSAALMNTQTATSSQAVSIAKQEMALNKTNFWVSHFGHDAIRGVASAFFSTNGQYDESKDGPSEILRVANELLAYKNPSYNASTSLSNEQLLDSLEQIRSVLSNIVVANKLTIRKEQTNSELMDKAIRAVYGMVKRPTMGVYSHLPKHSSVPTLYPSRGGVISSNLEKTGITLHAGPIKSEVEAQLGKKEHPEGYTLYPKNILTFYHNAYSTKSPQDFWNYLSRYRIALEVGGNKNPGLIVVRLIEVDRMTGAPRNQGLPVASAPSTEYNGIEGSLLSKVKASMFPEVFTLESGTTAKTDSMSTHYASELKNLRMMWSGMAGKDRTFRTTIVTSEFTTTTQQSTDLNSNPLETTSVPVEKMAIYLQPAGVREAMLRLVNMDGSRPGEMNAVVKWVTTDLMGQVQEVGEGSQLKFATASVNKKELSEKTQLISATIDTIHNILINPMVYEKGYHALGDKGIGHLVRDQAIRSPVVQSVKKVFAYSQWPTGSPIKAWESPVNDLSDVTVTIATIDKHLRDNQVVSIKELPIPEGFNGRFVSQPIISKIEGQAAGLAFDFKRTSPGTAYPMTRPKDEYTVYRANYYTIKKTLRVYSKAKGLITGKTYSKSPDFGNSVRIHSNSARSGDTKFTANSEQESHASVAMVAGGAILVSGIIALGIAKRR
jgi:hypothetical protein